MNAPRPDKHPNAPRGAVTGQDWPAFRYSPDGEGRVFHSADEVPEGWLDHPAKHKPEAVAERKARTATLEERAAELEQWNSELRAKANELKEWNDDLTAREAALLKPPALDVNNPDVVLAPKPKPDKAPRPVLKLKKGQPEAAPVVQTPTPADALGGEGFMVIGEEDDADGDE